MTLTAPRGPVPNQATIQTALRTYLLGILPAGVEVFEGQDNRVPEPKTPNFVIMTTIARQRLATNIDTYADVQFTGAAAGNTLTVSSVKFGSILLNSTLFCPNVIDQTIISQQLSGVTGGVGTYKISQAQTLTSQKMAAGNENLTQKTKVTVQLDVHSNSLQTSSDMAQTISTLLRDQRSWWWFNENYPGIIVPLYADDPKQIPFQNAEMQWESRYVISAELQADQTLMLPQKFADQIQAKATPVEALT